MHFAHFECVNEPDNAFRFFRYEITQGFFGVTYLKAVAGRIGTEGTIRDLASGSEASLAAPLVKDARKRARHGYRLIRANLPPLLGAALDGALAEIADGKVTPHDVARARTLKAVRALLREHASDTDAVRSVDLLLSRVEPDKKFASSHTRNRRRRRDAEEEATSKAKAEPQRAQGQLLRDVVALIARELLRDDPLAALSVQTGLELPFADEINGSNVTFLRLTGDRILSMSVEQFIQDARLDGEPSLDFDAVERLRAAAIDTVGDLVRWDHRALQRKTGLTEAQAQALVRSFARYRLHFNMEEVRFVRPRVRA